MLRLEGYVEIQVLKRQGKRIRAISAELGVSRNTVRKYLRSAKKPRAKVRPERVSKLESFREYIQKRVRETQPAVDSGLGPATGDHRAGLLGQRIDLTNLCQFPATASRGGFSGEI